MAKLAGFNEISIRKKTAEALKNSRYEGLARNAANTRFVFAKQALLSDFDEHPVTKEMEAGPYATEKADGLLPYGNLPAFLGNTDSQKDVENLRGTLEKIEPSLTKPQVSQTDKQITYSFKVKVPEVEEIYRDNPSEWSSMSWIKLVEDGLNNFGAFIFSLMGYPSSFSGTGLQRGDKGRSTVKRSPKIPYITEILRKFRDRFNFEK